MNADEPKRLTIRKYPNRRYYDTNRSRHVTLEEIYKLICQGYEVQVTDSKTGQDITAKVLAQIIIDLDPPKLDVFPVAMLHRLLRSNEQIVQDFVQRYFNQPLMAFLESQRNAEQAFRHAIGLQAPAPTMADWAKMFLGPFGPAMWTGARQGADAANGSTSPNPPRAAAAGKDAAGEDESAAIAEDEDLKKLVRDLRVELAELRRNAKSRRPSRARTPKSRTSDRPK